MTRWLLALLFAFGTVTFITGCSGEEETTVEDVVEEGEGVVEDVVEEGEGVVEDVTGE
ncbi:MAG: hypothetical protein AAF085_08255 [Planctomycetota bacterium]